MSGRRLFARGRVLKCSASWLDAIPYYKIPLRLDAMPTVSAKLQITLPVDQCREVGIGPGDQIRSFVADGRITIMPMVPGSAKGCLRHLNGDPSLSDEDSLRSALAGTPRSDRET